MGRAMLKLLRVTLRLCGPRLTAHLGRKSSTLVSALIGLLAEGGVGLPAHVQALLHGDAQPKHSKQHVPGNEQQMRDDSDDDSGDYDTYDGNWHEGMKMMNGIFVEEKSKRQLTHLHPASADPLFCLWGVLGDFLSENKHHMA